MEIEINDPFLSPFWLRRTSLVCKLTMQATWTKIAAYKWTVTGIFDLQTDAVVVTKTGFKFKPPSGCFQLKSNSVQMHLSAASHVGKKSSAFVARRVQMHLTAANN